jgi:hypothetical protein
MEQRALSASVATIVLSVQSASLEIAQLLWFADKVYNDTCTDRAEPFRSIIIISLQDASLFLFQCAVKEM